MEPILHSFAYSLDYLRDLIADVTDESMTEQPNGIANHPSWTIGHLVFIAQAIGGVIGIEPWLGEEWAQQFGPRSKPGDLSAGPHASPRATPPFGGWSKDGLLNALTTAQTKLTTAVKSLTDAELDAPFPDPSYADVFPTVRHALTHVLLGHTAFHIGQISMWRHAMKFPPMARSYE
ncbi:MAG: DinB family protein [bacterium]|nr:DinB family protein [bacterium]